MWESQGSTDKCFVGLILTIKHNTHPSERKKFHSFQDNKFFMQSNNSYDIFFVEQVGLEEEEYTI